MGHKLTSVVWNPEHNSGYLKIECYDQKVFYSHISSENPIEKLKFRQEKGSLQLVVVEWNLARPWAIKPGLHKGGPGVLQQKTAPDVVLADAGGTRKHRPAAVMLHGVLTEKEVGEVADVIGGNEVGLWVWQKQRTDDSD